MTRINLVHPTTLTDKHLMAEYRELPRIFTAVSKDTDRAYKVDKPCRYTLGKGHVKFFYDKLKWLYLRYKSIIRELLRRGFRLDKDLFNSVLRNAEKLKQHKKLFKYYHPTPEEIYLNMARLVKRSNLPEIIGEINNDNI